MYFIIIMILLEIRSVFRFFQQRTLPTTVIIINLKVLHVNLTYYANLVARSSYIITYFAPMFFCEPIHNSSNQL